LAFHDELVVKKISLNMLIDSDYWIFPPEKIEVFSSNDGQNYKKIAMKFLPDPQLKDENFNKTISFDLYDETAKFLKLKIVNRGLCPDWHQGRGKKAWIFFNEVIVEWKLLLLAIIVELGAALLDRFSWFPILGDWLTMLMEGNTCDGSKDFQD